MITRTHLAFLAGMWVQYALSYYGPRPVPAWTTLDAVAFVVLLAVLILGTAWVVLRGPRVTP